MILVTISDNTEEFNSVKMYSKNSYIGTFTGGHLTLPKEIVLRTLEVKAGLCEIYLKVRSEL
jgi:hypothetical protein